MNNNKDKHRSAAKITGDTVDKIFAVAHSGVDNIAFGKFLLCVYCFVFLFLFTNVSLHFFFQNVAMVLPILTMKPPQEILQEDK